MKKYLVLASIFFMFVMVPVKGFALALGAFGEGGMGQGSGHSFAGSTSYMGGGLLLATNCGDQCRTIYQLRLGFETFKVSWGETNTQLLLTNRFGYAYYVGDSVKLWCGMQGGFSLFPTRSIDVGMVPIGAYFNLGEVVTLFVDAGAKFAYYLSPSRTGIEGFASAGIMFRISE